MNYTTTALVCIGFTQKIGEGLIEQGWVGFGGILRCQVGEIVIKGWNPRCCFHTCLILGLNEVKKSNLNIFQRPGNHQPNLLKVDASQGWVLTGSPKEYLL